MKIAYLIDKESLGGGCEYIRQKIAVDKAHGREGRVFYSDKGECSPSALDSWGADVIVVNHVKALMQILLNPFRRPRGSVTFVVHGIHLRKYAWRIREGGLHGVFAVPLYWMRRILEAYLYRRCDAIIALTESDRADILRLYGQNLNIRVERNTLNGWVPSRSQGLPNGVAGSFDYVCIGRFNYQKGQDRWIRGIRGRTLFIGDGETLEGCKRLARRLCVEDKCVFAGAIPDADRYLGCAPVVVSPSRWEGMPFLMMKARALGCRILATDCPGNRDVLDGYDKWERLFL